MIVVYALTKPHTKMETHTFSVPVRGRVLCILEEFLRIDMNCLQTCKQRGQQTQGVFTSTEVKGKEEWVASFPPCTLA